MCISIFLSMAQVKKRPALVRRARRRQETSWIPVQAAARFECPAAYLRPLDRVAVIPNRNPASNCARYRIIFSRVHCHLRRFYYISRRIAVLLLPRRNVPHGLSFPSRGRYNLPRNLAAVMRYSMISCHTGIGETAYGDEGGVVSTPFCRDNDSDPVVPPSGSFRPTPC